MRANPMQCELLSMQCIGRHLDAVLDVIVDEYDELCLGSQVYRV